MTGETMFPRSFWRSEFARANSDLAMTELAPFFAVLHGSAVRGLSGE
jgi:hypothetical protein